MYEELRIIDRALFGSLGRESIVSLEGDVCKQAGFPVSFGGLGCRRYRLASMNSVVELLEIIHSRPNKADTNELAEAVESWRGSGGASLPDDPRHQKAW